MGRPPQIPASAIPPAPPPDDGVSFSTFSGLKNTVNPESLTARELSRAQNIDLDDLGQAHRRRGRRLVATGSWTALVTTVDPKLTIGVQNGNLVLVNPDYSVQVLLTGIAPDPVAFQQVGPTLYFSSIHNSGQVDLASLTVSPWGRIVSPSYQPGLAPAPKDWWYSPVVNTQDTLGAVGGKLLGPPPPGAFLGYHNGRLYIGSGRVLWATELFLYNYVDKNKGYRFFESDITGILGVEDGVYVGTRQALYFLAGPFNEHVRTLKEKAGVVPGSMIQVPGEMIDPEGRRFPDLPRPTSKAMVCMTQDGVVAGLPGGSTYNLTKAQFVFPAAVSATALYRQEDGMHTLVLPLKSGGTPADNARFGDYLSATVIRSGTPGQPGTPVSPTGIPGTS